MLLFYVDYAESFSDFSDLAKYQKNDLEVYHGYILGNQAQRTAQPFWHLKASKKSPFSHKMYLTNWCFDING